MPAAMDELGDLMKKLRKIQKEVGGGPDEKKKGARGGLEDGEDPFLGIKSHMTRSVREIKQVGQQFISLWHLGRRQFTVCCRSRSDNKAK
jgi:hypothetical protein